LDWAWAITKKVGMLLGHGNQKKGPNFGSELGKTMLGPSCSPKLSKHAFRSPLLDLHLFLFVYFTLTISLNPYFIQKSQDQMKFRKKNLDYA